MAIILVGDKPLEQWQEFVAESLEKVEQDEVEAVGVFLMLKNGGLLKGYYKMTTDHMKDIEEELHVDLDQQEMMDEEGGT